MTALSDDPAMIGGDDVTARHAIAAQRPEQPVTHGRWPQCGAVGVLAGSVMLYCDKPVGHDIPGHPRSVQMRAHRVILEWSDPPEVDAISELGADGVRHLAEREVRLGDDG
jgi:hypothetical protein